MSDYFPDQQADEERGHRLWTALRVGDTNTIRALVGESVVIGGRATPEAQWGVGYDFLAGDVFVRVHGNPTAPELTRTKAAAHHVLVRGRVLNVYVENKVLVLSVKADEYFVTGTT